MDSKWTNKLSSGITLNTSNGRTPRLLARFGYEGGSHPVASVDFGGLDASGKNPADPKRFIAAIADLAALLTRAKRARDIAAIDPSAPRFSFADYFPGSAYAKKHNVERSADRVTVSEKLDAYLKALERTGCARTTLAKGTEFANNWVRPRWGKTLVAQVTKLAVQEWLEGVRDGKFGIKNAIAEDGQTFDAPSSGTAKLILRPLLGAVEGLTDVGVAGLWKVKAQREGTPEKTYNVVPFNAVERTALLGKASEQWARMLTFWWDTGLRVAELAGLCTDAIEWKNGKPVSIEVKRQWEVIPGEPSRLKSFLKTGNGATRIVELRPAAAAALVAQLATLKVAALPGSSELVFVWPKEGTSEPMDRPSNNVLRTWTTLQAAAGVTYRNIEQCRHTCASILLAERVQPLKVAKQLGHSVEVLYKHYARVIEESETPAPVAANDETHAA